MSLAKYHSNVGSDEDEWLHNAHIIYTEMGGCHPVCKFWGASVHGGCVLRISITYNKQLCDSSSCFGCAEAHWWSWSKGWKACVTTRHAGGHQFSNPMWLLPLTRPTPDTPPFWEVCKGDSETGCSGPRKASWSIHDRGHLGGSHGKGCSKKNSSSRWTHQCIHQCSCANNIGRSCCWCGRGVVSVAGLKKCHPLLRNTESGL